MPEDETYNRTKNIDMWFLHSQSQYLDKEKVNKEALF